MKVGFIGLGHMGSGMAANLLRAGHEVTVYNRTRERAEALAGRGGANPPADARAGEVVFTMLANDDAVEGVVYGEGGVLASLAKKLHPCFVEYNQRRLVEATGHHPFRSRAALRGGTGIGRPDLAAQVASTLWPLGQQMH